MALPALQVRVPNPANAFLQAEQIKGARAQTRALQQQEQGRNALLTAFQGNDFRTSEGRNAIVGQLGQTAPLQALQLQQQFGQLSAQEQAQTAREGQLVARAFVGVGDQASYDQARAALQQSGVDVTQMPPQFNPQFVQSSIQAAQSISDLTVNASTQAQIAAGDRRAAQPTPPRSPTLQAQEIELLGARQAATAAPSAQDIFKNTNTLRDEFNTQTKEFVAARTGFEKVQAAANDNSGAGDVALIFGFMKTVDPGSTVREGEFATAQNTASVDERVRGLYNSVVRGERLTPDQRARFTATARSQFEAMLPGYENTVAEYTRLAGQFGLDPAGVIINQAIQDTVVQSAPTGNVRPSLESMPRPTTQEGYDALPKGAWYVDPNGVVGRKP